MSEPRLFHDAEFTVPKVIDALLWHHSHPSTRTNGPIRAAFWLRCSSHGRECAPLVR